MSRGRRILAGIATASALGLAATAGAAEAATTFSGTCTIQNLEAKYTNAAGPIFQTPGSATLESLGASCTGTKNGAPVTNAPAEFTATVTGATSCLYTRTPLRGPGTLVIGGDTLKVNTSFGVTFGVFKLGVTGASGAASGSAFVDLITTITDPDLLTSGGLACYIGTTDHGTSSSLPLKTSSQLVSLP